MVRELDVSVTLPVAPRTLLRLLYSECGDFTKAFHAAVTKDEAASVTTWARGSRTVTFTKRLDLPQAILKLIGACLPGVRPASR